MASTTAVKMAAIFMLVLAIDQLMAEASPQPRRLLAEGKHAISENPGFPDGVRVTKDLELEPILASPFPDCPPGCQWAGGPSCWCDSLPSSN
ncbi:unnamed protein product [Urochloa decumbens]|uniref:Uncharacterized protein n=1 Tax=Urochloa decumbens TaxID=240449 RepID=A0ABC9B568_9POAL